MLKPLLAVSILLPTPAPVVITSEQPTVTIPRDRIARRKFPHEKPAMIDGFAALNREINAAIQPESDEEHYGVAELWVMFPEDMKGDCEDYALTKLGALANAGFPAVMNTRIVGVMVNGEGHAILAIRLPKGEVMYLDNLHDEPMTRRELIRDGYQFPDWVA